MLENLCHPRNIISSSDFLFKCVLESIQTLLPGVWLRQLATLAVVGAEVADGRLCSHYPRHGAWYRVTWSAHRRMVTSIT